MVSSKVFSAPGSKWTTGCSQEGDIVISCRVRLARNLADLPFPWRLAGEGRQQLVERIRTVVGHFPSGSGNFLFWKMDELDPLEKGILIEKHLISPNLAQEEKGAAVAVREDEGLVIMVNEEDHLRIQSFLPGLQLEEAWRQAGQVDNWLEEELHWAFDEKYGYLTACPTNAGTGMRASVMVHLPALIMTKNAEKIFATLPKLGLTVRGIYGEGSQAQGNLFQISNQVTMGITEEEIIQQLQNVLAKVIEQERKARLLLQKKHDTLLYDNIWRAYGVLRYARVMSSQEYMELISRLRLGADMGILPGVENKKINEWMISGQPSFLQHRLGRALTPPERDWERAALIREEIINTDGGGKE